MGKIATKITPENFKKHIEPYLSKAKRGYVSRIGLEKIFNAIVYKLVTGCQWKEIKIEEEGGKSVSYQAIYWHYRKWSKDGSLKRVWEKSLEVIEEQLDLSELNLDGSHTIAKKGAKASAIKVEKRQRQPIFYR